jgi:hypothetical protein
MIHHLKKNKCLTMIYSGSKKVKMKVITQLMSKNKNKRPRLCLKLSQTRTKRLKMNPSLTIMMNILEIKKMRKKLVREVGVEVEVDIEVEVIEEGIEGEDTEDIVDMGTEGDIEDVAEVVEAEVELKLLLRKNLKIKTPSKLPRQSLTKKNQRYLHLTKTSHNSKIKTMKIRMGLKRQSQQEGCHSDSRESILK